MYYRDNFFVRYIREKYFIQVFVLTLHFIKRFFFQRKRGLNFDGSSIYQILFFYD